MISESPPPGSKPDFLYNLRHRDRLRKTLAKFFGLSEEQLIEELVRHNVLWDMAVRCRPPSKGSVEPMARECSYITKLIIEELKPRRVIALGRIARKQLNTVLKNCRYVPEVLLSYHPLYVVRFRRDEVANYFKQLREWLDI